MNNQTGISSGRTEGESFCGAGVVMPQGHDNAKIPSQTKARRERKRRKGNASLGLLLSVSGAISASSNQK